MRSPGQETQSWGLAGRSARSHDPGAPGTPSPGLTVASACEELGPSLRLDSALAAENGGEEGFSPALWPGERAPSGLCSAFSCHEGGICLAPCVTGWQGSPRGVPGPEHTGVAPTPAVVTEVI